MKREQKIKILFVAVHRPDRSPSQRFRFEQYIEYMNNNGFECKQVHLISEKDDAFFYKPGNFFKKSLTIVKGAIINLVNALNARNYDIVFVQREAYFLGTTIFEELYKYAKTKLIFDFDDAIWLTNISEANKKFSFLKNHSKISHIIKISDMVFAGNQYLAGYAANYNHNVRIIPTTIDTEEYKPTNGQRTDDRVCVGWSGSFTTIMHFEHAISFLTRVKAKHGDKVYIKVIGDTSYRHAELGITGLAWNKQTEVDDLSEIDIGIMPLPDDEWAKGKCGLKGLQYMALGIATIMSPVGVNTEIINDGVNGYLATSDDEWVDKLDRLIESADLRKQIGDRGRDTVIEKYSVISQREKYVKYLQEIVGHKV